MGISGLLHNRHRASNPKRESESTNNDRRTRIHSVCRRVKINRSNSNLRRVPSLKGHIRISRRQPLHQINILATNYAFIVAGGVPPAIVTIPIRLLLSILLCLVAGKNVESTEETGHGQCGVAQSGERTA